MSTRHITLREKCPYSELFWSAFSRIRTEYGEIRSISLYSVRMGENADQNNSEYGYFLSSVNHTGIYAMAQIIFLLPPRDIELNLKVLSLRS